MQSSQDYIYIYDYLFICLFIINYLLFFVHLGLKIQSLL